jgi:uncharacterized protein
MTDNQITDFSITGLLLLAGLAFGLLKREHFNWRWFLIAIGLLMINNFLLVNFYSFLPDVMGGDRNWQGKALALLGTLIIAALTVFGWKRIGLTLNQEQGSLRAVIPAALLYCLFFAALAFAFSSDPPTTEEVAFQLTMPGIEEELFFRGLFLLALDRAFLSRVRFLGVDWGWGAVLSSFVFGLGHAFGFSDGSFSFDPAIMAMSGIPSFLAVWMRYRTGSLLVPVLLHNFGNSIDFVL